MHSFNRTRRLIKKAEFNHVFENAKKIVFGNITILYRPNSVSFARLGFAISKKFVSTAVLRNKIRRILKESFRLQTTLPAYDIVVLMNKNCDKQKIEQIQQTIERLWQKLSM